MAKVWVLNEEVDHEGESTLGVYATKEEAEAAWSIFNAPRNKPWEKYSYHMAIYEIEIGAPAMYDWDRKNNG